MSAEESRREATRERFIILRLDDAMDDYVYVNPASITSIHPRPPKGADALCEVVVDRHTYIVHDSAEDVLDNVETMLARRDPR